MYYKNTKIKFNFTCFFIVVYLCFLIKFFFYKINKKKPKLWLLKDEILVNVFAVINPLNKSYIRIYKNISAHAITDYHLS